MRTFLRTGLLAFGLLSISFFNPWTNAAEARQDGAPSFLPLLPVAKPRIVSSSTAYPGGRYEAVHLVDGDPATEYSSRGDGTNTFVEFDFGQSIPFAAFRHQDRNDPATVQSSELTFLDSSGQVLAAVPIVHANARGGITFFPLTASITAQRVRWRITGLGPNHHSTVGGAEIHFYAAGEPESLPLRIGLQVNPMPLLERVEQRTVQPINVTLEYPYATPVDALIRLAKLDPVKVRLSSGSQTFRFDLPPARESEAFSAEVKVAEQSVTTKTFTREPVRRLEIHILPHSHVDIGYTALQADVAQRQIDNIDRALELIEASQDFPFEARFRWNVEVLWPVENYLQQATPEQRADFLEAVKRGRIGLDGLYGNILTGLCRPEELIRSLTYATQMAELTGVPIESAMISDVPGYTWSTVTALVEAGVKYFSFAPNYFDRMGGTMVTWQNQPFLWGGPDGQSRVLCWCPAKGYALGHILGDATALPRYLPQYLLELEAKDYAYDLAYLRWSVHGDNGPPDEKLSEVVKQWNEKYAFPRLVISTTAATFRKFEKQHGTELPVLFGDYTPYWEDGAASSALETALNRASAERLVQAETVWGIRSPGLFPNEKFYQAWRNVLLYSEHTWGAHNSVSQPDVDFVKQQWQVKKAFAWDADRQSRELLNQALGFKSAGQSSPSPNADEAGIAVYNTCSWERTDLVTLAANQSSLGDQVVDSRGNSAPAQRLSTGELVFLAEDIPPLAGRKFQVQAGAWKAKPKVKAEGHTLIHPQFTLRVDERTGAIASFQSRETGTELVDAQAATALNDYFYLPGADLKNLQRNGASKIVVKENGPLVASLLIESEAPGCRRLTREIRVAEGLDFVEIINTIDKKPARDKEGLHFGFGFNVPAGVMRLDVGLAAIRPEQDQLPAACKNWFSVQRWVDISNEDYGVTWATVDAPLVEVGGITANLIGSQTNPDVWIKHLPSSQTIYSWVMNNHWHTNYRAEQEGPTVFRYYLRPHPGYDYAEAARFGASRSQPLIVSPSTGYVPNKPRFELNNDQVLVSAFKPSDDGQAWIVRLFNASNEPEKVKLDWSSGKPKQTWLSDTSEKPRLEAKGAIRIPRWGLMTLRVEF